eukprot:g32232.t1
MSIFVLFLLLKMPSQPDFQGAKRYEMAVDCSHETSMVILATVAMFRALAGNTMCEGLCAPELITFFNLIKKLILKRVFAWTNFVPLASNMTLISFDDEPSLQNSGTAIFLRPVDSSRRWHELSLRSVAIVLNPINVLQSSPEALRPAGFSLPTSRGVEEICALHFPCLVFCSPHAEMVSGHCYSLEPFLQRSSRKSGRLVITWSSVGDRFFSLVSLKRQVAGSLEGASSFVRRPAASSQRVSLACPLSLFSLTSNNPLRSKIISFVLKQKIIFLFTSALPNRGRVNHRRKVQLSGAIPTKELSQVLSAHFDQQPQAGCLWQTCKYFSCSCLLISKAGSSSADLFVPSRFARFAQYEMRGMISLITVYLCFLPRVILREMISINHISTFSQHEIRGMMKSVITCFFFLRMNLREMILITHISTSEQCTRVIRIVYVNDIHHPFIARKSQLHALPSFFALLLSVVL